MAFVDTMGTLIGVSSRAGFLDENGQLPEPAPTLVDNGLTAYADMDAATIDELFYRFLNGANKDSDNTTAPTWPSRPI